jgi:hypothetical protein
MRSATIARLFAGVLFPAAAFAQNPTLHVSNRWKDCSFQLDAALTQSAWRQFTAEAGEVVYFRPLADARPMSKGRFEVSALQWGTAIDDNDAAWNDTFVHPDSTHWLVEGARLAFTGLTARMGMTNNTDVGVYFTKSPNANYGFVGGQVQRSLARSTDKTWAAAARVSVVRMFGPDDLGFSVYGVDMLASRTYALAKRITLSPYAGISATLARAQEKSSVTNVSDENVLGARGTLGAAAEAGPAKLGVEYGFARVSSFSIKIGVGRM